MGAKMDQQFLPPNHVDLKNKMNHVPRFEPSTKHETSSQTFEPKHNMDFVPAKGIFSGRILRLQDDEEVVRAPQHSGGCRLMINISWGFPPTWENCLVVPATSLRQFIIGKL